MAGKRAGLREGKRSGLWFEFERIIGELRSRWVLIEQVPGLLSSHQGRDFALILNALDELGYGVAWRVLDAQNFGVPQRRRRVFIVGHLGDIRGPSEVLALGESSLGDSATSGQARQEVAGPLGGSSQSGGFRTTDLDNQGAYVVASTISASAGHHGHSSPRGDGSDNLVAFALTSREHKGVSQRESQSNLIPTVTSKWAKGSGGPAGDEAQNLVPTVAFTERSRPQGRTFEMQEELAYALTNPGAGGRSHSRQIATLTGVRRLTPRECERLMGWPDDHTRWTADGREIADTNRYKLCGNGVVSTVAEYIGHRLVHVDRNNHG